MLRSKGEELYTDDRAQEAERSKVPDVHHTDLLHIGLQVGDGRGEVESDHAFSQAQRRDHRKEEARDEGVAAAAVVWDDAAMCQDGKGVRPVFQKYLLRFCCQTDLDSSNLLA